MKNKISIFFKYFGLSLLSLGSASVVMGLILAAKNSLRHSLLSTSSLVFSGLELILGSLVIMVQPLDSNSKNNEYSIWTMLAFIVVCLLALVYVRDEQDIYFLSTLLALVMFFAMFYMQIYEGWKRLSTLELKDRLSITISLAAFIISLLSLFK